MMVRVSSRKIKPTSKFEEFKLTSTGKKRGRPRKHPLPVTDSRHEGSYSSDLTHPNLSLAQNHVIKNEHHVVSERPHREIEKPNREAERQHRETEKQNRIAERQQHAQQTSTPIREPRRGYISSRKEEMMRLREENLTLKSQLDQLRTEYEELKRQTSYTGLTVPKIDHDDLKERYQRDITFAKRHEWCVVCLTQSRYYCCWNTTYCSQKCQVADWYARHGKSCERRKSFDKKISSTNPI